MKNLINAFPLYNFLKYCNASPKEKIVEECDSYGHGTSVGQGEFMNMEQDEEVFYCHYTDKEMEENFHKFKIIYKEKRIVQRVIEGEICTSAYYDYILSKKNVETMEEKNPDCPCKKVKCERHGNCVLCRDHHSSPKSKYLPTCERIKKK